MDVTALKARKAVVEKQIATFQGGVEQAGRGDKYVRFRDVKDLYGELKYLDNQIAKAEGRVARKVYMKNGGRGYV